MFPDLLAFILAADITTEAVTFGNYWHSFLKYRLNMKQLKLKVELVKIPTKNTD